MLPHPLLCGFRPRETWMKRALYRHSSRQLFSWTSRPAMRVIIASRAAFRRRRRPSEPNSDTATRNLGPSNLSRAQYFSAHPVPLDTTSTSSAFHFNGTYLPTSHAIIRFPSFELISLIDIAEGCHNWGGVPWATTRYRRGRKNLDKQTTMSSDY